MPVTTRSARPKALPSPKPPPGSDSDPDPEAAFLTVARRGNGYVPTMTSFLDLPYEIREKVYMLALVVRPVSTKPIADGIELLMEPIVWPSGRKPHWKSKAWKSYEKIEKLSANVLLANKRIHNEAAAILYGENIFRLPNPVDLSGDSCFTTYATLFRKVVIYMSMEDLWCGIPNQYALNYYYYCSDESRTTAVKVWENQRKMLTAMTNLTMVHTRIEDSWREGRNLPVNRSHCSLKNAAVETLPYLREWSQFLLRGHAWLRQPSLSAQFNESMSEAEQETMHSVWSRGGIKGFRDIKIGFWE